MHSALQACIDAACEYQQSAARNYQLADIHRGYLAIEPKEWKRRHFLDQIAYHMKWAAHDAKMARRLMAIE